MSIPGKPSDQQVYQGLWDRLVMVLDGDEESANTYLQEAIAASISQLIDVKEMANG